MVIVTHEMEIARSISSRVFYMDEIIYEEVRCSRSLKTPKGKNQNLTECRYYYQITVKITFIRHERRNRTFCEKHLLSEKYAVMSCS